MGKHILLLSLFAIASLMAMQLTPNRLSARTAIDEYDDFGNDEFEQRNLRQQLTNYLATKYDWKFQDTRDIDSQRRLTNFGRFRYDWEFQDESSALSDEENKEDSTPQSPPSDVVLEPLKFCGRLAPFDHELEVELSAKHRECPLLEQDPSETTLLLLEGYRTYGRTGNNLIELFHALQYGKDHNVLVGIMMGTWPLYLITDMWMSIPDDDINAWSTHLEQSFCVKMISQTSLGLGRYKEVIRMETRDLYLYRHVGWDFDQFVDFQSHILRTLYRSYNDGTGLNIGHQKVKDMCSVMDAVLGEGSSNPKFKYSVIHSRSMEGVAEKYLRQLSSVSGCDPVAALKLEPEYIKQILGAKMLRRPIVYITDGQSPEQLETLLADPKIGPMIRLVPEDASWIGGDIMLAANADIFIGNPASTFASFIAKSRVALGWDNNFLFRKKNNKGKWVNVCDDRCIFDKEVPRPST